ncbi:TauD/TfdA family dioxygenase [Micromonospora sp. C31]|uniref:TauD/TfdA family dioxygenase n=1 Tax=Micromonospora sp. C31 TaxID=2824876 RepID=UPI001B359939|nr:TauD/TfdA family dioxygenase [Micromonospora sp. C31]MBQ1075730.1 TauD/TfdA family dioxygenase [Micromonospora sp. C31]
MDRRPVQSSGEDPVTFGFLPEAPSTPVLVTPAGPGVDLPGWLRAHREAVEARLLRHGAVLLRGFHGGSVEKFEEAASALCATLYREYGDLPREGESNRVYKSTPYPEDLSILFHNESSHLPQWPMRQFFSCIVAPRSGGQTPIVDCRTVLARMRPELVELFATKKLRYVRNFIEGVDVSWSRFFGTEDPAEVERRCAAEGTSFEWTAEGGLRTSRQADAVLRHPVTGEAVFFNQLALHHPSALDPEIRSALLEICEEEQGMPRNVFWGDGTVIDDAVVAEVRDLMDRESVAFTWQEGDILVIDNMLVAHSRSPFTGPRKIVVALGDMTGESVPAPFATDARVPPPSGVRC